MSPFTSHHIPIVTTAFLSSFSRPLVLSVAVAWEKVSRMQKGFLRQFDADEAFAHSFGREALPVQTVSIEVNHHNIVTRAVYGYLIIQDYPLTTI